HRCDGPAGVRLRCYGPWQKAAGASHPRTRAAGPPFTRSPCSAEESPTRHHPRLGRPGGLARSSSICPTVVPEPVVIRTSLVEGAILRLAAEGVIDPEQLAGWIFRLSM